MMTSSFHQDALRSLSDLMIILICLPTDSGISSKYIYVCIYIYICSDLTNLYMFSLKILHCYFKSMFFVISSLLDGAINIMTA